MKMHKSTAARPSPGLGYSMLFQKRVLTIVEVQTHVSAGSLLVKFMFLTSCLPAFKDRLLWLHDSISVSALLGNLLRHDTCNVCIHIGVASSFPWACARCG